MSITHLTSAISVRCDRCPRAMSKHWAALMTEEGAEANLRLRCWSVSFADGRVLCPDHARMEEAPKP